jgi:hypothetical protein
MKKISFLVLAFLICACPVISRAEDSGAFKKYNPDGIKYEFARSYIASLAYLNSVDQRWKKSEEIKKKGTPDKFILWNQQRLVSDNMDIRVAKNYMTKYFIAKNRLMLKATDTYVYACDQLIDINRQERTLWENAKTLKDSQQFDAAAEKKFLSEQEDLALRRKEAMRGVVSSSVLMTKVLLSEDTREKDIKKHLAISAEEREHLLGKLDSYAKDNLDWSMKPGQTFMQAAEASVREVLEDSFYLSAGE